MADELDLSRRIDEASSLEELDEIEATIQRAGLPGRWRFKVIDRRRALRVASMMQSSDPAPPSPNSFAAEYGIGVPDGRRLHAYRLSTNAFERLQADLSCKASYATLERGHLPGLFVLWASEWFRRFYRGDVRKWEDLTGALGLFAPGQNEQAVLRSATSRGLKMWRREIFSDGNRQYLETLVREGGFPAAAVEDGGRGWARDVLSAVIGPLLGNGAAGEAEALELARRQLGRVSSVFRDEEFVQLCADLALAITYLRREADPLARAAGIPVAAWLHLNRAGWRDQLPLTTGDGTADALVEALLRVEAVRSSLAGAERLLWRDSDDIWKEGARLTLDGEVSAPALDAAAASHGRLRAFAAGPMARFFPGELALFEPPVSGDTNWFARAARQSHGIKPMPLTVPVELDLRAGEGAVTRISLNGGKPRRGQLLVTELADGESDTPAALRVIGSGSGSYRAEQVYLRAPADWKVTSDQGEEAHFLGACESEGAIWQVRGGATLTDPSGDRYRVLCGQASDTSNRLDLLGNHGAFVEVTGVADLYLGSPVVSRNHGGEIVWRSIGDRQWRPAPSTLPCGQYELGWRKDGVMLDRRRIAVLPAGARLDAIRSAQGTSFALGGFGDATITPANDAPLVPTSDGEGWLPRPGVPVVSRFAARIEWPGAPLLDVMVACPGTASLAHWDGRKLLHGETFTLDDLRELVAVADGAMELVATLKDAVARERSEMAWQFSGEMPLSAVLEDIASLLLPASLDATILLDMHDGYNNNWHVHRFPLALTREGEGFVASKGVVDEDVELCGRSFADAANEVSFGPYSLLSDSNHRPAMLPQGLSGTWLVYLRSGERVLTRPAYKTFEGEGPISASPLARAMSNAPGVALDSALREFLSAARIEDDAGAAPIAELVELVASLRGLPPVVFRALELLPSEPLVLARMALTATGEARDAVLALAEALPFAWHLLPLQMWNAARGIAYVSNLKTLTTLGDQAAIYAKQMVDLACAPLVERDPLLSLVLEGPGETESIEDITQHFIHRGAIDRIKGPCIDRYRTYLRPLLPQYFERFNHGVLDTFDAPCAAALAVAGKWVPDASDIRHMKLVARSFPTWFSEAFAASLKEYL